MNEAIAQQSFPELVLRGYTALFALSDNWAGSLVLSSSLDGRGEALALAVNIAGGLCLAIEERPETLRAALRSGACDFVVNSIDEALRTLKNEARKRAPLAVGVEGDPAASFAALVERGILPELVVIAGEGERNLQASCETFSLGGAEVRSFEELFSTGTERPDARGQMRSLIRISFADAGAARRFDREAARLLSSDDSVRTRWLLTAPRVLPRSSSQERALWLGDEELAQLTREAGPFTASPS